MFQHNSLFLMHKAIFTILLPLSFTFSQQNEKLINTCGKLLSYQNRMTEVSTLSEMQEKIDISYYDIDISIDIESEQISGNVFLSGSVGLDQPDSIELDLSNSMTVDSIYVNNLLTLFDHDDNKIKIPTPEETLTEGYDFNVQIFYHGLFRSDQDIHKSLKVTYHHLDLYTRHAILYMDKR